MNGSSQTHVYLCHPTYNGQVSDDSAEMFYKPGKVTLSQSRLKDGCSLISLQFNLMWMTGVCEADRLGLTHWAMIHADVIPEREWLTTMLAEMDRTGCHALAAVVPMKGHHGWTSTSAEGRVSGGPHYGKRVHRRVTVAESLKLPKTFDHTDVQLLMQPSFEIQHLLLNTGLLLVDIRDRSWLNFTPFNIYAEIDWGSKTVLSESEDWHFSRKMHAMGKRLCATTAVKVEHVGPMRWPSWKTGFYLNEPDQEHRAISLMDAERRIQAGVGEIEG